MSVPDPDDSDALIEGVFGVQPRFERGDRLGKGGMGQVDAVRDRHVGRVIARKVLDRKHRQNADSVRLFLREARITGQLDHPAIVPLHDLGLDENDQLFFTMKRVDGDDLRTVIHRLPRGRLPPDRLFEMLAIVLRVCEALSLAHERGVVHRDIKPENVMVGPHGEVYLVDWGVAHVMDGSTLERVGEIEDDERRLAFGTPHYMAPEQARATAIDPRTDIYGVGGLLYEILTRRKPHPGRGAVEVMAAAAQGEVVPPSECTRDGAVPRGLERIVMRALRPEPIDRYPSIEELSADLTRFMRGGGEFPSQAFAEGEIIIREGDQGDAAYILVDGSCRVEREVDGAAKVLRVMERGSVFGEMAILASGRRTASVIAHTDCRLLVITSETLTREVEELKPWVGAFIKTLAKRFESREVQWIDAVRPVDPAVQLSLVWWWMNTNAARHAEGLCASWTDLVTAVGPLARVDAEALGATLVEVPQVRVDASANTIVVTDPGALALRCGPAV